MATLPPRRRISPLFALIVLLKTRSNVLIFDPNSDFRSVGDVTDQKYWTDQAGYDQKAKRGHLIDEHTYETFTQQWRSVEKIIYWMKPPSKHRRKLCIDWTRVSIDILSEDLGATLESELRHCHDFVRTISDLSFITKSAEWREQNDILKIASDLCSETRPGDKEKKLAALIRGRFEAEGVDQNQNWTALREKLFTPRIITTKNAKDRIEELYQKAALHRSFVSDETEKFYFSNAYAVTEAKLLSVWKSDLPDLSNARLKVVDLPSIAEVRFRLLAVSTLLATEWTSARRRWEAALVHPEEKDPRVPTFIVVDEAHNLIPGEPRNHNERWLREQFRTIAAEGRKFGLFLILVSQRPDKLDPLVLSECANRAVMKVGSEVVLKKTGKALGLGDIAPKVLERCLEFDVGRALITGPWATEGPTFLYGATRRTKEGGRNLRSEHWAKPQPIKAEDKTTGAILPKHAAKKIAENAMIAGATSTSASAPLNSSSEQK